MTPANPESRWPPIMALCVLFALVAFVPDHLRVMPHWVPYVVLGGSLVTMAATALRSADRRWQRIERGALLALGSFVVASAFTTLVILVGLMVEGSRKTDALTLLTSSVVVWAENVVGFAFLYWMTDGGGLRGPDGGRLGAPDWTFPSLGADGPGAHGRLPAFVDYLFLAFSTATAFSAADTVPLSQRAKLMMMLQASISMVTLAVVAARAINVLGS